MKKKTLQRERKPERLAKRGGIFLFAKVGGIFFFAKKGGMLLFAKIGGMPGHNLPAVATQLFF